MFSRKLSAIIHPVAASVGMLLVLGSAAVTAQAQTNTDPALRQFILRQPHLPDHQDAEVDSAATTSDVDGKQVISSIANETMNFSELSGLNPNANVLYAGSLVQGHGMMSGTLSGINVARGAGSLVLSPLGSAARNQRYSANVSSLDLKTVEDARNRLLRQGAIAPAGISQESHQFYSVDDAMLKIGASASYLTASIKGQLETNDYSKTTNMMLVFTQRYYTLSVEDPSSPTSYFAPGVSVNDMSPYASDSANTALINPTMYISSVTYGRQGILICSSSLSSSQLKASLDAAYGAVVGSVSANMQAAQQKLQATTDIKLLMLGGDSNSGVRLVTDARSAFNAINEWVSHPLSAKDIQLGVPISYRVNYLKDNTLANVAFSTKFTKTQISDIPSYSAFHVEFNTTDDDKDGDTQLRIEVLGPNNKTIADYQGSGGQNGAQYTFKNSSRNDLDLTPEAVLYVRDLPRTHVHIHIDPNGHDSWNFNFRVTAVNSLTGARELIKSGAMNLSQHTRDDTK